MQDNQNISNNEIKILLEENMRLNQEIFSLCKQIEHYNKLSRIYGLIKTVVIVVPLIIGILYFIPYVGDMVKGLKDYQQTMGDLLK